MRFGTAGFMARSAAGMVGGIGGFMARSAAGMRFGMAGFMARSAAGMGGGMGGFLHSYLGLIVIVSAGGWRLGGKRFYVLKRGLDATSFWAIVW